MAKLGGVNPNLIRNLAGSALDSVLEQVNPFEKVVQRELRDFKKGYGLGFKTDAWTVTIAFENKEDNKKLQTALAFGLKDNIAKTFGTVAKPGGNVLQTIQAGVQALSSVLGPFALGSKLTKPLAGPTWKGFCQSIRIPGTTFNVQNPYGQVKVPMSKGRQDLGLVYYNDQFNVNYQFWRNYMDYMAPGFDSVRYFDDYSCTVYIDLLTTQQNRHTTYKFSGCAPVSINDQDLGNEAAKEPQTVQIAMTWEKFEITSVFSARPNNFLSAVIDIFAPNLEADEMAGAAAILAAHMLVNPGLLSPQLGDSIRNGGLSQTFSNILNGNPVDQQNIALDPDLLEPYARAARGLPPKENITPEQLAAMLKLIEDSKNNLKKPSF